MVITEVRSRSETVHHQHIAGGEGKATVLVINRHRDPRVNKQKHSLKLGQYQKLYTTTRVGSEGKATVLVINRHRDPRVNRLTSIDEEKQGALDNVEARREKGGWWHHTGQVGVDGLSLKHEITGNNGAVTSA